MAIFKVPRITTSQRQGIILQLGEIVFDTDQEIFYGGDDVTQGGFAIGQNAGDNLETIELQSQDIFNKFVLLQGTPLSPKQVIVTPEGGIDQRNGIDYKVIGNRITWDSLGLDGFLEEGDIIIVQY